MALHSAMIRSLMLVLVVGIGATAQPCPHSSETLVSDSTGAEVTLTWKNSLGADCMIFWIDMDGRETPPTIIRAADTHQGFSYVGHSYRVRTFGGVLIREVKVSPENLVVEITTCDEAEAAKKYLEFNPQTQNEVCPEPTAGFASANEPGTVEMVWISELPFDVLMYWVDQNGDEVNPGILTASQTLVSKSINGHAFRFRTFRGILIKEARVDPMLKAHVISACGDVLQIESQLFEPGDDEEYESLKITTSCEGPSDKWSCVRLLNEEQYKNRNPADFGFIESEIPELINYTIDNDYVTHIGAIPRISPDGPGFLIMRMPIKLKTLLQEFYVKHRIHAETHEPVPKGFTNNEWLAMKKLNLDNYQTVRSRIVVEMRNIMQWWCRLQLRHTSTYGVRIYRRDSMLTNHVDIMETHLASAVLQVAQTTDPDGGWPLEVLLPNKTVGEVYLQPGEMVLYEGGWIRHGRPMRFKGDEFANIFTHFAPLAWTGPSIKGHDITSETVVPHRYYGYERGRCNTVGDNPELKQGCVEPQAEVSHNEEAGDRDEL